MKITLILMLVLSINAFADSAAFKKYNVAQFLRGEDKIDIESLKTEIAGGKETYTSNKYFWQKTGDTIVEEIKTLPSSSFFKIDAKGELDSSVKCSGGGCQGVNSAFCNDALSEEKGFWNFTKNALTLDTLKKLGEAEKCYQTINDIQKIYKSHPELDALTSEGMAKINTLSTKKYDSNRSALVKSADSAGFLLEIFMNDYRSCIRFEKSWAESVGGKAAQPKSEQGVR